MVVVFDFFVLFPCLQRACRFAQLVEVDRMSLAQTGWLDRQKTPAPSLRLLRAYNGIGKGTKWRFPRLHLIVEFFFFFVETM